MAYGSESRHSVQEKDLTDALKNTTKVFRIAGPITILRVFAIVTVVADADMTVTITRRITVGSDTGAVSVTTLTIPNTTAAGKVVYKDITPVDCQPGDEIKMVVSNTGTNSAFELGFDQVPRAEVPANLGDMVLSA